jgi:hypothetical protein
MTVSSRMSIAHLAGTSLGGHGMGVGDGGGSWGKARSPSQSSPRREGLDFPISKESRAHYLSSVPARARTFTPWLLLILVWIASRVVVAMHCEFWSQWDVFQARKLLEYGFWERGGALTWMHVMGGTMPYPQDITSSTHPYPGVWLYAALYAVGGASLCLGFAVVLKLASSLAVFALLQRWHSLPRAWLGAALYILAPVTIVMDFESNIIGLAAALFPFGMALILAVQEGRASPWWLALFTMVGGLIDWAFYYQMPALLWLAAPAEARWREAIPGVFRWPATRALLIGAAVASVLFLIQIAVYFPEAASAISYIRRQTGVAGMEVSRARMLAAVAARNVFFVGPALFLGAAVGVWLYRHARESRRALQASLVFIVCFIPVQILFLHFCFVEFSQFAYLVLPMTLLATHGIARLDRRFYTALLLALAVAMAAFFSVRTAIPRHTAVARAVAAEVARHSNPSDVVLTNLRSNHPPFEPWDTGGLGAVMALADRLVGPDVFDAGRVRAIAGSARRNFANVVFALSPDHAVSDELAAAIREHGEPFARATFTPPPQPTPPAARLRVFIWKFTGRYADRAASGSRESRPVTLEFYRMRKGWAEPLGVR